MDKGSYTFAALESKYEKFTAPAFEITIGSKTFASNELPVTYLEVEQSADGSAGGCTFCIDGQYNPEGSKWENDLGSLIQVGAKLTINGGYIRKKELFYGYIDEYTFEYGGEDAPRITVTGMDGLGYLMSLREPTYAGKKKAAELIRASLNKSVSAGFAKSVTVGSFSGFDTPILKEQVDDWRFLNLLAQRYGASLFAIDGELIFDDVTSSSKPIMTLAIGAGLRHFTKRVSLAHQVGKVEIRGRDINQKPVKGTADSVTTGGSGKSAAQLVPALQKAVLREYSEYARTEAECALLAQNRLNGFAMGLVSGEGTCIGIPELIPGRYVKIDGFAPGSNGTYFLSKVRHRFDADGYQTTFEIKGAKTE